MFDKGKWEKLFIVLKQPSTIKGIILLLSLSGWIISPEKYQEFIEAAIGVYALIAIFLQDS